MTEQETKKKLTVDNIDIEDLIEEALSICDGFYEAVFLLDNGEVVFSGQETPSTEIDSMYKIGTLGSMCLSEYQGIQHREDGKYELDVIQLGESGIRPVVEGEYYDKAEILTYKEAFDLAVDIEKEGGDDSIYIQIINNIERVWRIRQWAKENAGKYVYNTGNGYKLYPASIAEQPENEAILENSLTVEDFADSTIEEEKGEIPEELQ